MGFAGVFGFTTVLGKLGAFSFMPKDKLFMWNRSIMSTVNALYASVVGCYALVVMAKMNDYSIWKFIMNSSHLHIYSFANKCIPLSLITLPLFHSHSCIYCCVSLNVHLHIHKITTSSFFDGFFSFGSHAWLFPFRHYSQYHQQGTQIH